MFSRKSFSRISLTRRIAMAAAVSLAFAGPALAAWPERPVTMIVPWSAGGGTDATARIVRAIAHDEHAVLPVSVRVDIDGVGEVCLSLPSVVGRHGVLSRLAVPLDDAEQAGLRASAAAIRTVIDTVT